MQTSDTAQTPPRDTSTRRALLEHLQHVVDAATQALQAVQRGAEPYDQVAVTRYVRSEAQQAAAMAAYAGALQPEQVRRG